MKLSSYSKEHWLRNLMTRTLLVVGTIAIIVWFLPRTAQQHFHYDIGKPWPYATLIAKFEFPIYKSDEAVKAEKDSLMQFFEPYYTQNDDVERVQTARLLADMKDDTDGLPRSFNAAIVEKLHELYETGIVNKKAWKTTEDNDTSLHVRVVSGKQAISVRIDSVYTTMAAYEKLLNDPQFAENKQELQKLNLNEYIAPNLIYDKDRSEAEQNDLLSGVAMATGTVVPGQRIVDRGQIVDAETFRMLSSYERELNRRSSASDTEMLYRLSGQLLIVTILVLLFTIYLQLFRRDYFDKPRSIMMLYAIITLFPVVTSLMVSHAILSVYLIPFAIAPIFVRVFMDSRTAFITHTTMILASAVAVKYQYEFIIIQLLGGLIAIYSLRELSNRAQVFKTAIFVTIGCMLIYFALQLMQASNEITIDRDMFSYFIFGGILLLLAYPLMYLIEKTFGFTSNVTLFELSNTNKGLLRDLSEVAPGTFQHSITVGNLASEIANRIGANALLVRTGALYHDIGKMTDPVFFTENQAGVNPHDNIPYTESARIVINHVTEGIKMAERYNLPVIIKNFILTHHGKGMAKYFYIKYKSEHENEEIDATLFSYPGPNPFTREQALLMMADGVEAASRSLTEYTEENIKQVVERIIDAQVAEGYFAECPITFRDIALAKSTLIERLKSIYHTRITYPEDKQQS